MEAVEEYLVCCYHQTSVGDAGLYHATVLLCTQGSLQYNDHCQNVHVQANLTGSIKNSQIQLHSGILVPPLPSLHSTPPMPSSSHVHMYACMSLLLNRPNIILH